MKSEEAVGIGNQDRNLSRRPIVLIVDDNQGDYHLTKAAFDRASVPVSLYWVENGEDALTFLRNAEPHTDTPVPDLILLDLKMPITDGIDVLKEAHSDDNLKHIPVVVLTVSNLPADVYQAYRECCRTYMVKPLDFEEYSKMIQVLCEYWFRWAILPGLV